MNLFEFRRFRIFAVALFVFLSLSPALSAVAVGDEESTSEKITSSKRAVLRIFALSGGSLCSGTGFLISSEGCIVTNRHVVKNATDIVVYILSEDEQSAKRYSARCIQDDINTDLALLMLTNLPENLPEPFSPSSCPAKVFDEVVAIGFPAALDQPISESADISSSLITDPSILENLDPNITKGAVSKVGSWVVHDAKIASGNSGGPLIDISTGKVVGVNTAKTMGNTSFYMAIPVEKVIELVGRVSEAWNQMEELKSKMDAGDTSAMAHLGALLYEGKGGYPLEPERGLQLLEEAAEKGDKDALFKLGCIYSDGVHVRKDMAKAISYLERCGSNPAKMQLFCIYAYGFNNSFPCQPAKAYSYAKELYEQGDAEGKCFLASCYRKGIGVKKNFTKAIELLRNALEQERAEGEYSPEATELELAETLLKSGDKKNIAEAVSLLENIANDKESLMRGDACCMLALLYFRSGIVKTDLEKHIHFLRLGAEAKNTLCIANLGIAYLVGNRGLNIDLERGRALATESVERGGTEKVYYFVGSTYLKAGYEKIGMEYLSRALDAGSSMARNEIAIFYLTGKYGFKQDKGKAIRYLRQSTQDGEDELAASVAQKILNSISGTAPHRASSSSRSGRSRPSGGGEAKTPHPVQSLPKRNAKPW